MIEKRYAIIESLACLLLTLLPGTVPVQAQTSRPDLASKREQQQQVQADTDQTVRRVGTMLRVLDYYQLDKRAERQLLDEVAETLGGLSRAQMNEVIARLEAAAKARDEKHLQTETEGAYVRHREIVAQLRRLLTRYDAVKSLDQAAERLEQTAKKEHELSLRGSQMAHEWRNTSRTGGLQGQKMRQDLKSERRQAGDDQDDLKRETASVLAHLAKLREQLPPEQQQRLSQAEDLARKQQVLEKMAQAAAALTVSNKDRAEDLTSSVAAQRQAAEGLQELARTLRTPPDRLAALREARDRVESVLEKQEVLRRQAESAAREPHAREAKQRERDLGDRQGRLELATRGARSVLAPQDQDLAKRMTPAEEAMRQAEDTLRKDAPAQAIRPQTEAAQTLRQVQKELEQRISQAEKEHGDPLAALQQTAAKVDRLVQEQKDLRDKAAEAAAAEQPGRLPAMTGKQQDLAQRAGQLSQEPSPARPETQAALEKAAESMDRASENLRDQKGKESVARQDEALHHLEEARKELAQQVAAMEKRRREIAALEAAAERLDQLTREQGKVAEAAQTRAQRKEAADTKDLARQQGTLEPEAREVGKQVEQAAPEAGSKVTQATEKMETARAHLDRNQATPGAREANAATDRLKEAQKAVARALDEKRGADLAEQAAMQPDNVDTVNAADQVAKALEQTRQAAVHSQQAAGRLDSQPKTPDLARLQQQVAEQAGKVKADEAGKPAADAARALRKGDLKGAIEQQQKALEQLEQRAAEQGEAKQGESGNGMPKPAQARNAGELARAQKGLLEATQALARSQEATQEALAALSQAQAQAPQGVQGELQQAGAELSKAGQQLQQGAPAPAQQSQLAAAAQLSRALKAMNAALASMGQQPRSHPRQGQALALGQKPGQGQRKGQGQGKGRGPGQERNGSKGSGDRVAQGKMSGGDSPPRDVTGAGSFLHLPPRQREMIRQALTSKLPAQYAAMIQQFYVNIASGKPAASAVKPARR